MADDRVDQLGKGYKEDCCLGEPPDLGPLRGAGFGMPFWPPRLPP